MPSEDDEHQFPEELASKFITVTEACEISGFTPSYIRQLLRKEKIAGRKIGRDWWTTEEAIRDYLTKERRPGPKTNS